MSSSSNLTSYYKITRLVKSMSIKSRNFDIGLQNLAEIKLIARIKPVQIIIAIKLLGRNNFQSR